MRLILNALLRTWFIEIIYRKQEINIFLYLQSANLAASLKSKLARRPTAEAASGWSNDIDGDDDSGYVIDYKE